MKRSFALLLLGSMLVASCNSATPTAIAEPITVQYTAGAVPWLAALYGCAGTDVFNAEQRTGDFLDPQSVDLVLRVGEPANLNIPSYKIGNEDILVIVNRQNPINHLTAEEVHGLFSGSIQTWKDINGSNSPVQVWSFFAGEDIQEIFEQTAMNGSPITSTARLASGPDEMSQAIANDVNAVGILSRHWKMGNVSDVYTVTNVPVLAISSTEPQGEVLNILACLQSEIP